MDHQSIIAPWDLECLLCDEMAEPQALPLSLLKKITDSFSDEQEIGRGGFAVVYKGRLQNRTVAVKRSTTYMHEKEFQREVACLMMVKHKNIIRFLGYCSDTQGTMARDKGKFVMADVQQRLLCFEYLPKGSLHEYINDDTSSRLQWSDRYQIIKGICHGLHYLHQINIVHLDLKPANVLLDNNLEAKIADFGLSRCLDEMESRIKTTKIGGTLGYLAPEFGNGEITYKFDIYSLGVIMLEILTGKKGYQDVDKVVESWSNMLDKPHIEVQQEQIRVCAQIGIECTNFNPSKRPDTQHIIRRLNETESTDIYVQTCVLTSDQVVESSSRSLEKSRRELQEEQVRVGKTKTMDAYIETGVITSEHVKNSPNDQHQGIPNSRGDISSKENAVTVEGTNPFNNICENTTSLDKLNEAMQNLNPDIRRCFEFCSIFPRGSKLRRDDLVRLWIAQGFVKTSYATEDMEERARWYIQDLLSISFLEATQPISDTDCFTINDALHDILDKVAANCLRIENASSNKGECWEGDVPRNIEHLLIQHYDGEFIMERIIGLKYLRTLIVYIVGKDTPIEEKVIESICKRLRKLQVLAIAFSQEHDPIEQPKEFSFPESVGQLKYLRYLAFRANVYCKITLPSTINKLRHIQLLDFGNADIAKFTFAELVNLRHIFCWEYVNFAYLGKLSSLQTFPGFEVSNEQGCQLIQLWNLNKLQGKLYIRGLKNVKSKAQALQANLTAKERLTELSLLWSFDYNTRCSREVEADVLEGLCPPVGLKKLELWYFAGCRYPDWMLGKHSGGPTYLQELHLGKCSQRVPDSGLAKAFPHLRVLKFSFCSWDDLPANMENLTSLKKLNIHHCKNILSLPSLPQSLEEVRLTYCNDEFMKSCQTVGHANWQKIEHIPSKLFC